MLYILIALIIIAAILALLAVMYITIDIHYKEKYLTVLIWNKIYKRKIEIDLSEKGEASSSAAKSETSEKFGNSEKRNKFKDKLSEFKERVYSKDNGFNISEAKNIKDELIESYSQVYNTIKQFSGKMRYKIIIPMLRIKLEYGTGDPASTGLAYSSVWGMVGILYPIAARYLRISYPTLDITPDFYGKRFDVEIRSIIKVRPAHIINTMIFTLFGSGFTYLKNKNKKGSVNNVR